MRVLLVTHQFAAPFSGVGTYARSLAYGLLNEGIETHVLCPRSQCVDEDTFVFIKTREIPAGASHIRWICASWLFSSRLRRTGSYDMIHFLDAREALFMGRAHSPVVGTIHDYYFTRPLEYWKYRSFFPDWWKRIAYASLVHSLEPYSFRKTDHIIANSKATAAEMVSAYRIPDRRLSTIYIGLRQPGGHTVSSAEPREPAVLFVGGNPYRKGLPRLVRSMGEINREIRADLWIVGTELTPVLKRMISASGLADRISVFRHLNPSRLRELYSRASCLAVPGLTEAFGLVFLEAFANGCPVIGPRHGGSSEIITDGRNGFLVNAGEDSDLTGKLLRLLREPELRRRLASEGGRTLHTFTPERMVKETVGIYHGISS